MNKLAIPVILAVTVMIAGMFAFMPVEQASTIHAETVALISGASVIVSSDTISDTFAVADSEFHWVVLESTVPYTIQEIEVRSTIDAALGDAGDEVRLQNIVAFPAEYDTSVADITLAIVTDTRVNTVCDNCVFIIIAGDDTKDTLTVSFTGLTQDNDTPLTKTYGSNVKILVEIEHVEDNGSIGDMSSVVTFYLSGPDASQVTVTTFLDQADIVA